jgi:cysteine synthase A
MRNKLHLCRSMLDAIGNTPLVELSRLTKNLDGRIVAKLEYLNPGFSKKDRIALQMIEDAEKSGRLKPGQTVIELTSGNTGTGLAIVCGIKGYPFIAVMSKGNSIERARMMYALGAEVVLVDQASGSKKGQVSGEDLALVENETQRIIKARKAFRADQFSLQSNFDAHYLHTGPEIITQAEGNIDIFCDFAGTGGSFGGIARALKEHNPKVECYLVEPESCAVYAGKVTSNQSHKIQGGGYSMPDLKFVDKADIDGFMQISDEEAILVARRLAREEGIFGGFSSGANAAAALALLKIKENRGKTVVILCCDSGLKYLSTDLWDSAGIFCS